MLRNTKRRHGETRAALFLFPRNEVIYLQKQAKMYALIDRIRRRPGMYIGTCSPTHLGSYLSGYYTERKIEGSDSDYNDFYGFHDWVARKFDYFESTSGWANMIEDQCEDKMEALWLFYELLDEYRGIEHEIIFSADIINADKIDRKRYCRLKKVRGTFAPIEKPTPEKVIIRSITLGETYYSLVATGKANEVLFVLNLGDLEQVFKLAEEIFGLQKFDWQ